MTERTASPHERELDARLEQARGTRAWRNYVDVRERVLRMMSTSSGGEATPSEYWREELAGFEYMFDASPLIVETLRHHCYHITGLRAYDYRTNKDATGLARKLDALIEIGGSELLVPESRELGGFGFEINGSLYNVDTLKYFEALIALDRGEVLGTLRRAGQRPTVMEIGSGWGGFAYQFKTAVPNSSYVMVDLPELFLFSATYLMTLFPEATFAFYGDPDFDAALAGKADFVFIPHTAYAANPPERLDLTINMVSFQEMTSGQVEAYVRYVYDQGCPFLYSLNRDRSRYNTEISSVREIIDHWYWRHEVSVLPVSYTKMLGDPAKAKAIAAKAKAKVRRTLETTGVAADDYRHVVGWRRLEPGGAPAATPSGSGGSPAP